MGTSRFAALIVLALTLAGSRAQAETPLEAGRTVTTLAGSKFDFEGAVRQSRATVLVFWSAGCPCVRRYEQRVESLLANYGGRGVKVLGVASNAGEDPAAVQRAVKERGLKLEVLHDPGGRLADAVGARSTPTVAVLDREGKVA